MHLYLFWMTVNKDIICFLTALYNNLPICALVFTACKLIFTRVWECFSRRKHRMWPSSRCQQSAVLTTSNHVMSDFCVVACVFHFCFFFLEDVNVCRVWNLSVSVGVIISFTGRGFALKLCLTAESKSEHRNKKNFFSYFWQAGACVSVSPWMVSLLTSSTMITCYMFTLRDRGSICFNTFCNSKHCRLFSVHIVRDQEFR